MPRLRFVLPLRFRVVCRFVYRFVLSFFDNFSVGRARPSDGFAACCPVFRAPPHTGNAVIRHGGMRPDASDLRSGASPLPSRGKRARPDGGGQDERGEKEQ